MKRFFVLFAVLCLSIFTIYPALFGQGVVHNRSFIIDGVQRSYLLYEPAAYTGQEAWPLVINYHGFDNISSDQTVPSFWALHNNCLDSIVIGLPDVDTTDNCTVTLIEYVDCDSTEVLFYRVNNGGHAWPGGSPLPPFLGNVNRDINASSKILNFFKRNPMPDSIAVSIDDKVGYFSKAFQLYPNYPNPFNPSTTIKYSVPTPSQVELKIYNVLGQLVRTLVNDYKTSGEYAVVWDGSSDDGKMLASGNYFYRIKMGEFISVKRMTYLK